MTTPRRVHQRPIKTDRDVSFVGIDVGENFLDFAIMQADGTIDFTRLDLRGIVPACIASLASRINVLLPEDHSRYIALVDSPRWPRALDLSNPAEVPLGRGAPGRAIDDAPRRLLRERFGMNLHLFPTPDLAYFESWMRYPSAKPRLRAFYSELFESTRSGQSPDASESDEKPRGRTFTRFMLFGFATYRALDAPGIECYDSRMRR